MITLGGRSRHSKSKGTSEQGKFPPPTGSEGGNVRLPGAQCRWLL